MLRYRARMGRELCLTYNKIGKLCMTYNKIGKIGVVSGVVSTNRPRGGENPLTTGVKKALPYRTDREAWYLPVSTE
jgi:hypothetical protein